MTRASGLTHTALGLGMTVAALVGVAAAGSLGVYAYYTVQVRRQFADLRRAGQAVFAAEMRTPTPPPSENAADDYERLFPLRGGPMKLGQLTEAQRRLFERSEVSDAFLAEVRAAAQTGTVRQTLAALRRAAAKPHYAPSWSPATPEPPESMLAWARFREAARFCVALARMHAHYGETEQAADCLATGLGLGRHVCEIPTFIAPLVAMAIYQLVEQAGRDVLREGDLPPQTAQRLAAQLRDNRLAEAMRRGFIASRAYELAEYERYGRNPCYGGQVAVTLGPLTNTPAWFCGLVGWNPAYWRRQQWILIRDTDRLLRALDDPREAVAVARVAFRPEDREGSEQLAPTSWDIGTSAVSLGAATAGVFLTRTRLGLWEATLAVHAYHSVHGRYPASLQAAGGTLSPDPFSGRPFIYRRDGTGFILYSVGPNGRDDGGRPPSTRQDWLDEGDIVWSGPSRGRGRGRYSSLLEIYLGYISV